MAEKKNNAILLANQNRLEKTLLYSRSTAKGWLIKKNQRAVFEMSKGGFITANNRANLITD